MKSIEEIYQEMLAAFADHAGMAPTGTGELALRLYAAAAQIHSLWLQAEWTRRQCFPQTADGEYLDYHAQMRALERRTATVAEGTLCFSVDSQADRDLTIPAGTVCLTMGLVRFETTEEATLAAGGFSVDVPAKAVEPGAAGNVEAGAVVTMLVAPVGVARVTNTAAFTGGADDENDESLRERILESYKRLPNGANAAFYEQGALTFEQVAAATVIPRSRGIGTVDVIVATHAGMPDEDLLEELKDYFESRREIAVKVDVLAPEENTVNVSAAVKAAEGYDRDAVIAAVKETLRGYFGGRLLSQGVLRARLGALIYAVEGVENYVLNTPETDVPAEQKKLPVLGELAVSAL